MGPEISALLREEAKACRETASGPCGEYGNAFWVAAIVLENLAKRLDEAAKPSASDVYGVWGVA